MFSFHLRTRPKALKAAQLEQQSSDVKRLGNRTLPWLPLYSRKHKKETVIQSKAGVASTSTPAVL